MNKRLGAIAVVACVCGLLFSGAASARQAANKITVTGAVLGPAPSGTYVQFWTGNSAPYGDGTPFKQISFSGGSNFHFSWIEGNSGCDLGHPGCPVARWPQCRRNGYARAGCPGQANYRAGCQYAQQERRQSRAFQRLIERTSTV